MNTSLIKLLISEELLGTAFYGKKSMEVYKNPKSIIAFDPEVRAISDSEGSLYVVDDSNNWIHSDLYEWLKSHNHIDSKGHYYFYDGINNLDFIAWQRDGKTTTFKLGESYSKSAISENMIGLGKMRDAVKRKNPQFTFKLERIW